ncbi:hypothetical protein [Mycoplasmopsis fermentans]|uniref:Uncharacterized protein n=1 Tax=Mycoplasmopsis fermentans (strain M64) TaxID=943945 RepID=A0AB32XC03_MYCFM|nr:hypothetical protein [Mycoplasmopsis fermentans]YP_044792.1 hypothetical protein phiMFV1_p04 [Mycoplasma phage phiMFV1]AAT65021.1 hypothetical protein [Mycoplasma phage phiMFV1]AAT65040.1 hypothetical protein [Mycoplasma phage phiMFV1]AAT65060.1 hypothetical protein [Mycoplasma phage phiMFV1]ADV34575.1 Hypothetical Protein MfeM64YM_0577 [Mycoplasmopsis fermentans M64]ADV34935.1 Hypothetical Protein MfeM64YM_0940 [Mycoplasmopsis fermentans M64]
MLNNKCDFCHKRFQPKKERYFWGNLVVCSEECLEQVSCYASEIDLNCEGENNE